MVSIKSRKKRLNDLSAEVMIVDYVLSLLEFQAVNGDNRKMGYTKSALSGFSWNTILKAGTALLTLVKIVILARLLSPTDFGLFALVAITLGLTEAVTQTGINITILQSKKTIDYFLDTAWVIAIIRGFLIGLLMLLMGWGMSYFYQEPLLFPLIFLAVLVPMIKGFINPSIVLLHKELRFFHDSLYRFCLTILAAILLAWLLGTVWALVLAIIIASLIEVTISFLFFSNRPVFHYLPDRAKHIFQNAKSLNLTAILHYLNDNIDDVILGRLIGTHSLGLYHNAYSLSHKPNFMIAAASLHSTLPVYIKIADDTHRLQRAFLRTTSATMALAIIATLPLFFFPDLIVSILLGDQWLAIIPAIPWLAAAGLIQSFSICLHTLCLATKNYRPMNFHLLLSLALLIPALFVLAPVWGVTGAALAVLVTRVIALPVILISVMRYLKTSNATAQAS
jgi:O-antigen/teichoic acid export membrane protein